jgi:hypothetical protein
MTNRYGVGNPGRFLKDPLLGAFNEYAANDAVNLTRLGIVKRATAISGIGGRIELEDGVRIA